jgi:hypothetical protein
MTPSSFKAEDVIKFNRIVTKKRQIKSERFSSGLKQESNSLTRENYYLKVFPS